MKKNNIFVEKIYFGILMLLISFIYFYFFNYMENKFCLPFFLYSFLFIVLFFIIFASKEILKLNKHKKNLFLEKNMILFSFIIFFYLFSILTNYFDTNKIIIFSYNKKNFFLYKMTYFLYQNHYFLFFSFLYIFIFFLFFLFIYDFKICQFQIFLFSILYITFFSSCFFILVSLNYRWFWYLFLITVTNDSFAFFGGILFGKTKIFPSVSPNKTLEGCFFGIIFSLFFSFLFFLNSFVNLYFKSYLYLIFFSFCNSIISQIGDLISSKLKRNFKIKDFNNIFPGHGGLLDRFDSVLFLSFFNILILVSPFENFKQIILNILVF
ncbi:phosphatidate cytidylyltransferase [Candidatus Phytoplasma sacchari]|uniref:Phosphatidate cytidylyltransferase n=1 Tax=Candidatus Phytoplasma sacchari TaxID=2609813 RepID=A0ABY7M470_9MOLU|nr:phosphatidate cytidylyltransferase [Candidatus Phytoplasma sacchari]